MTLMDKVSPCPFFLFFLSFPILSGASSNLADSTVAFCFNQHFLDKLKGNVPLICDCCEWSPSANATQMFNTKTALNKHTNLLFHNPINIFARLFVRRGLFCFTKWSSGLSWKFLAHKRGGEAHSNQLDGCISDGVYSKRVGRW